ncbi:MAG: hypothetical protein N3B18_00650 [Desulfobacterota bacterium]|nr:hypothetical protein [Thermodesulfobacteriota bacterium]
MMIIEMWILGKPNIMLQIIYGIIIYFTFWFAYLLAFSGFFIDWDMRLFIREAQAHAFGAQEHTPVHNIVIMLIRGTAYLLKLIAPRSDALLAAKVLTTGFSSASACLLFLLAANLTSNIVLAISTVLVWFILPGKFFSYAFS